VGSLHLHLPAVLSLLQEVQPHLLFLQEAADTNGAHAALACEARNLGYVVHPQPSTGQVVVALRGLNVAPMAGLVHDNDGVGKVQRLGWQIGQSRILVRHRHAHPSSKQARRELQSLLLSEPCGQLTIDAGDFNEYPDSADNAHVYLPPLADLSPRPSSDNWKTTIDGYMVSPLLARGAEVARLPPIAGLQHAPVRLNLSLVPDFHEVLKWSVAEGVNADWDVEVSMFFVIA
jgi:hypothetical protein